MVNNEFHLIGIATSNFQNIGNGKYVSYILKIEIEKFGSNSGKNFAIDVYVYGTNRAVDVDADIIGKQVAVNGYIDAYASRDQTSLITKLIAQNVYVLDTRKKDIVSKQNNSSEATVVDTIVDAAEKQNDLDDDLPF